jgi:hypothetical protein
MIAKRHYISLRSECVQVVHRGIMYIISAVTSLCEASVSIGTNMAGVRESHNLTKKANLRLQRHHNSNSFHTIDPCCQGSFPVLIDIISSPHQHTNPIVTGGIRGMGKAIALELASKSDYIPITYTISEAPAQQVCSGIEKHGVHSLAVKAVGTDQRQL